MGERIGLAELEANAREIGRFLKDHLPPDVGFTLWMYTYGDGGWFTYIASAQRDDMINLTMENLDKLLADPKTSDAARRAVRNWKRAGI